MNFRSKEASTNYAQSLQEIKLSQSIQFFEIAGNIFKNLS